MELSLADPKGLIRESYAIEGITAGECRSIFLDWALSLAAGTDTPEAVRALIAHYALDRPGHPMSAVLADGLKPAPRPARRGGRAARVADGA
ncbi:MAG: hypothetical protein JSR87_05440 [Proteobacteria bacterium]|nr:hypothetical protein [Pseudomonadota bacterium]MBS0571908.1 hypothetical protein [Pseudomonadota bacterium]